MLSFFRSMTTYVSGTRTESDRGATAVEYGLMVAAIAAVIVGIVFFLGGHVRDSFGRTDSCITTNGQSATANGQTGNCGGN